MIAEKGAAQRSTRKPRPVPPDVLEKVFLFGNSNEEKRFRNREPRPAPRHRKRVFGQPPW